MARGSLKQRKGTKNKWDGRIDIPGIDDKRKQLCKTFTANKLADAEKQFNKWVSEVQASRKDYLNNDIKLCSLYESWLKLLKAKEKKDSIRTNTVDWYNYMSRRILSALGEIKLSEIDYCKLEAFYSEMANEEISAKYIYEHFALLGRLFRYATNKGFLDNKYIEKYENYIKDLGLDTKPESDNVLIFTDTEMEELLSTAKSNYLLWLIINIIKETGMRRSEVLALQWKHINFKNGEVFVEQQLYKRKKFSIGKPKTKNGIRTIPMTKELRTILETHCISQRTAKAKLGGNLDEGDFVVLNEVFEFVDPNRATEWMRENMHVLDKNEIGLGRPAKWVGRGLHTIRHTFASYAIRAGVTVVELSEIMGHHSKGFTLKTYARAFKDSKKEAITKIDAYREKERRDGL